MQTSQTAFWLKEKEDGDELEFAIGWVKWKLGRECERTRAIVKTE